MNIKKIVCFSLIVLLASCASSPKPKINQPLTNQSQVSKTLAEPEQKGLKRVVGIARFSDETKRGNSFLLDTNNNRIGKQASDILSSRLTDSGKFIVLERQDAALIDKEKQSTSTAPKADYLILGSVSEYGRSTNSEVGVFSRNKIQTAKVTVNIRLVNTLTKQVVFSQEASGEATSEASKTLGVGETAGYDSQLDDAALSAAISKLVSNVMENLLDSPWQTYLLDESEGTYFMSGGESQGIKKGDVFNVISKGKMVKNPQTGMQIELPGTEVAKIKVIGFAGKNENALSMAVLESGAINKQKLADYVVREKE